MVESYAGISRRTLLTHIGTVGTLSLGGCLDTGQADLPGNLSVEWVSETASEYEGNHHAMATALVDEQLVIGIPRNGLDDSEDCGVVAIDATGEVLWSDPLPPEHCNAHAIGDIGVGDLDGDDRSEFLAATETQSVFAFDAATGEETFRQDLLDSIGYSAPVVADFTGDGTSELAVADFEGNLSVVRADGSVVWTYELEQPVYLTPIVADITGDEGLNLVINHGRRPSEVVCFDSDGEIVWRAEQEHPSNTWTPVERDAGRALVTTSGDSVILLNGRDGDQQWTRTVGDQLREVRVGDPDQHHVYATGSDGVVRALNLDDGEIQWAEPVTEDERMPAPAVGRVTGDGAVNVIAPAYDGTVAVFTAESGDLLARRRVETDLYTSPILTDIADDERDEILLLYGDARVAALAYDE